MKYLNDTFLNKLGWITKKDQASKMKYTILLYKKTHVGRYLYLYLGEGSAIPRAPYTNTKYKNIVKEKYKPYFENFRF